MKKKKSKTDGLGPEEIKRVRAAVRLVWSRCHARRLCQKRAEIGEGYSQCEQCKTKVPKVYIDHTVCVGDMDYGFLERLFCPSNGLKALCKGCHDAKTKEERKQAKARRLGTIYEG